jgi:hypothetical protein
VRQRIARWRDRRTRRRLAAARLLDPHPLAKPPKPKAQPDAALQLAKRREREPLLD